MPSKVPQAAEGAYALAKCLGSAQPSCQADRLVRVAPDWQSTSITAKVIAVGPVGQRPMMTQHSTKISQGGGAIGAEPLPGGRWGGNLKHILEREVVTADRGYGGGRERADIPILAKGVRKVDAPLLP